MGAYSKRQIKVAGQTLRGFENSTREELMMAVQTVDAWRASHAIVQQMEFGEMFAQRSVKGALTSAAVAWVLITPVVAAAKIWWSGTAVCIVGVTIYRRSWCATVAATVRRHERHPEPSVLL